MVMVEIDSNVIDAEPMKNKTGAEHIKAYQELLKRMKASGVCKPKKHVLDNEASNEYQDEIRKECKMEMVPPDTHRQNIAERAIQTFKNHFISILSGVDPRFPISLWSKLIPQAVLTLNLLRPSNVCPNVSAHAFMHGQFDYNAMPLAPLGCAVQLYLKPHRRKSWGQHANDGWYIGTSPKHYRCHQIWNQKTKAERICDTVFFKHKYLTQPTLSVEDQIIKAIRDLKDVIRQSKNKKGDVDSQALKQLSKIFNSEEYNNQTEAQQAPRVHEERQAPRVQEERQAPRVQQPTQNQTASRPKEKQTTNTILTVPPSNNRPAAARVAVSETPPPRAQRMSVAAPGRLIVECQPSIECPAHRT